MKCSGENMLELISSLLWVSVTNCYFYYLTQWFFASNPIELFYFCWPPWTCLGWEDIICCRF